MRHGAAHLAREWDPPDLVLLHSKSRLLHQTSQFSLRSLLPPDHHHLHILGEPGPVVSLTLTRVGEEVLNNDNLAAGC